MAQTEKCTECLKETFGLKCYACDYLMEQDIAEELVDTTD